MAKKSQKKKQKQKTVILSTKDHMKKKDMWLGSLKELKSMAMFILDKKENKFEKDEQYHVAALDKLIDEIVVNATDHYISNPDAVKNIRISFDKKTGEISVENDGPGIPIHVIAIVTKDGKITTTDYEDIEEAKNAEEDAINSNTSNIDIKWNPHILADCPFSGDNHQDNSTNIHIRGGINGVGMKLVNYNSKLFTIETIDDIRTVKYKQSFHNRSSKYDEPTIEEYYEEPYTRISFIPDYKGLGYAKGEFDAKVISKVIETRAYHAAVYVPKINVYYNDTLIDIGSLEDLVKMHVVDSSPLFSTVIKPSRPAMNLEKYNRMMKNKNKKKEIRDIDWCWEICVTPLANKKAETFSIINGVYVQTGAHIAYFKTQIVDLFRVRVEKMLKDAGKKKFQMSYITNNIDFYIKGTMDSPTFTAQNKKDIDLDKRKLEGYKFTKSDVTKLWTLIEPIMQAYTYAEIDKFNKKNTRNRSDKFVTKYTKAKYAGPRTTYKGEKKRYLFIPEGDSAEMLISDGLSNDKIKGWSQDYCGIFSIQGVPINARKNIITYYDGKTKQQVIRQSTKLKNNERIQFLMQVLGLDTTKHYHTAQERKSLKYDVVIAAVDQDEDGKGNIFSLLLGFISLFWPELIRQRFIQRMNTPIIVAINKKVINGERKTISFYSMPDYNRWVREQEEQSIVVSRVYDFKYIKGLAGTDESAIPKIFNTLDEKMFVYMMTDQCENYFDIYLGKDPDKRKKVLRTPDIYEIPIDEETGVTKTDINCEEHLRGDCKSYQRYNIRRSLPHAIDGLNPARRKILTCGRAVFGASNKKIKVANLGSDVVKTMGYLHGDASLHQTIIKMTQSFFGSNVLPLLKSSEVGFGKRITGSTKVGQPRYIKMNLNKQIVNLIYPPEDDYLLTYTEEEGMRCEPEYFIPIIPMAVVESIHLPAHGWAVCSWGRDVDSIFNNIRIMIKGKPATEMDISEHKWYGDIYEHNGTSYSVGKYEYNNKKNRITITELPHGVVSETLFKGNRKKEEKKFKEMEKERGRKIDYSNVDFAEEAKMLRMGIVKKKRTAKQITRAKNKADREYNEGAAKAHSGTDDNDYYDESIDIINTASYTIIDKPVVKTAHNKTNNKTVKIEIDLYKGGYAYIKALHENKDSYWEDPVIEYFHLRKVLYDNLSFLNDKGEVKIYKSYKNIMKDWFIKRKSLYAQRINRQIIILRLQIEIREDKNRYSKYSAEYDTSGKSIAILEKKLRAEKYQMYNEQVVVNPQYIPIDQIVYEAKENPDKISYNYIKDMKVSSLAKDAIERREKQIAELKARLKKIDHNKWRYFKGDILWLTELKALERIVKQGMEHGWSFNDAKILY